MIAGVLLLIGGAFGSAIGFYLAVPALITVGFLWLVCGAINVLWSRAARTAPQDSTLAARLQANSTVTLPADLQLAARPPVDRDTLLVDPLARAKAYRSTRGAPARGLITLACAAAAIVVGILGAKRQVAFVTSSPPATFGIRQFVANVWPTASIIAGSVLALLSVLGLLLYAGSSVERAATLPATVTIVTYRDSGLTNSSARPVARFTLAVTAQGHPGYRSEISAIIPPLAVPNVRAGARFPALAAGPATPDAVIVDWSKPLDAPLSVADRQEGMTSFAGSTMTTPAGAITPTSAARLRELDALAEQNLISSAEYEEQRSRILGDI